MFKEGTLVPTNRGVIPIEQFGFARNENEKSECKLDIMLKTYDGEWNRCIFQTYKKTKGVKIKLSSNFSIECSEEQKIFTSQGIKKAKNIKIGDVLSTYIDSYIDKGTYFTNTEKINYLPISGNDISITL